MPQWLDWPRFPSLLQVRASKSAVAHVYMEIGQFTFVRNPAATTLFSYTKPWLAGVPAAYSFTTYA
jgi:hypothetical protein